MQCIYVSVIFVFAHVLLMCYPLQTSLSDMSSYIIPLYISHVFSFLVVVVLVRILNKILFQNTISSSGAIFHFETCSCSLQ